MEATRKRRTRRRQRVLLFLAVVTVLFLGTFHRFFFLGNFDVVEPGRVYRSAQPGRELEAVLREKHVASVLNLRGGSPQDSWYANEVATTARLGVDLYDLPLSAERRPTRSELLKLIDLFGTCRYPLLIHCKSGADRTGLAVALYRMTARGEQPRTALDAFSLWRGHVPAFGPQRLHEPIDEYDQFLRRHKLTHSPQRLRDWVLNTYEAPDLPRNPEPLRPGPRALLAQDAVKPARR